MPFYIIYITSKVISTKISKFRQVSLLSNRIASRQKSLKIHENISNLEIVSSQNATEAEFFGLSYPLRSFRFFGSSFNSKTEGNIKQQPYPNTSSINKENVSQVFTPRINGSLFLKTNSSSYWLLEKRVLTSLNKSQTPSFRNYLYECKARFYMNGHFGSEA